MRTFLAALLIAVALSPVPAGAQGQPGPAAERSRQVFQALDLDNDGRISRIEARWVSERFASADQDGDGFLQPGEFGELAMRGAPEDAASAGAGREPRSGAGASDMFRRFDADNDGTLSEKETWAARLEPGRGWMARDANEDGRISPSEFAPVP